jgi:hypothetical protein
MSLAISRTAAITSECWSCVPCEKLIRATFIPAVTSARSTVGDAEAGPIVQTILVRAVWPEELDVLDGLELLMVLVVLNVSPSPADHLLLESLQQGIERLLKR